MHALLLKRRPTEKQRTPLGFLVDWHCHTFRQCTQEGPETLHFTERVKKLFLVEEVSSITI